MKKIIIIPILNEGKNILSLYTKIKKNIKCDILYIDDNSIDNSQKIIKKLQKKDKSIKNIFRSFKYGIGSAHKDGFKWCYKNNYDVIITMDGDGTHNPKYINKMINKLKLYDLVITNRFVQNGSLKDWPFYRVVITTFRHYLISVLLNLRFDASGGLRCINAKKIKLKNLLSKRDDYSYLWENLFFLHKANYNIGEISISLPYRKLGSSKMKFKDIFNAFFYLIKFFLKYKVLSK